MHNFTEAEANPGKVGLNPDDYVRIANTSLREHGVCGVVRSYDAAQRWYFVTLDTGPPWRGFYLREELVLVARSA